MTGVGTAANPYVINATGGQTTVLDTPTVDMTLTGAGTMVSPYVISSAVKISAVAGNVLTAQADGLAVTCEDIQDCVGNAFGPGLTYNDAGNAFTAHISTDPANGLVLGGDSGLYVPAAGAISVLDTNSVNLTLTPGGVLSADVIRDPDPTNVLTIGPAGVLVSCEAVQDCVGNAFGPGLTYNDALNSFVAHISTDAGNSISLGGDQGLFVPPGGAATITTANTPCITLAGNGAAATPLMATPVIQPGVTNLLSCTPTGLAVLCESVQDCVGQGFVDGLIYDDAGNAFRARIDPVAGNTITQSAAGLLVPAAAAAVVSGPCGVQGVGTVADPVRAKVGTWAWPCPQSANATSVYCDPTSGQLQADPPVLWVHDQAFTNLTFANLAVPAAITIISNATVTINNPSTCRQMMVIYELEHDVDVNLPSPNSGAVVLINGDAMSKIQNTGNAALNQVHVQGSKTVPGGDTAPGGSSVGNLDGQVSNGAGGATYSRAQTTIRGWGWAMNP